MIDKILLSYLIFTFGLAIFYAFRVASFDAVLRAPKHRIVYYIISFTHGLPFALFGCIGALIMIVTGHKPVKYGWGWCFEVEGINWGLELGLFFIAPKRDDRLKRHEHGHGIQNLYFGWWTILFITIPSIIRFWYREIKNKLGDPCKTKYDDIWFEGSATESGTELINRLSDNFVENS